MEGFVCSIFAARILNRSWGFFHGCYKNSGQTFQVRSARKGTRQWFIAPERNLCYTNDVIGISIHGGLRTTFLNIPPTILLKNILVTSELNTWQQNSIKNENWFKNVVEIFSYKIHLSESTSIFASLTETIFLLSKNSSKCNIVCSSEEHKWINNDEKLSILLFSKIVKIVWKYGKISFITKPLQNLCVTMIF